MVSPTPTTLSELSIPSPTIKVDHRKQIRFSISLTIKIRRHAEYSTMNLIRHQQLMESSNHQVMQRLGASTLSINNEIASWGGDRKKKTGCLQGEHIPVGHWKSPLKNNHRNSLRLFPLRPNTSYPVNHDLFPLHFKPIFIIKTSEGTVSPHRVGGLLIHQAPAMVGWRFDRADIVNG